MPVCQCPPHVCPLPGAKANHPLLPPPLPRQCAAPRAPPLRRPGEAMGMVPRRPTPPSPQRAAALTPPPESSSTAPNSPGPPQTAESFHVFCFYDGRFLVEECEKIIVGSQGRRQKCMAEAVPPQKCRTAHSPFVVAHPALVAAHPPLRWVAAPSGPPPISEQKNHFMQDDRSVMVPRDCSASSGPGASSSAHSLITDNPPLRLRL